MKTYYIIRSNGAQFPEQYDSRLGAIQAAKVKRNKKDGNDEYWNAGVREVIEVKHSEETVRIVRPEELK